MRISNWSSGVCASDLAVRRHFAAAIAADRDQRDALARRAVGRRIEMAGGEIMAEADDLVDEEGGRIRRDPPRRGVSQQPELNLGAEIGRASCRERECQSV